MGFQEIYAINMFCSCGTEGKRKICLTDL